MATSAQKCAHQACNCTVQQGQQYCSTQCQQQAQQGSSGAQGGQQSGQGAQGRQQQQQGGCGCGHPACQQG